ncbi:MAG: winged helix-turn-helix domain-containing protein [Flavobacteriales bacterium]|nr:winged helix-turn-helix domain-containing protein [Flavobacteriales bacterium]
MNLKKRFGYELDGKTLSMTLTRREIGDIAGTTTEKTIRTLSDFVREGIVNLEGKKIQILDLNKLIAYGKFV